MRVGIHMFIKCRPTVKRRTPIMFAGLLFLVLSYSSAARAQQKTDDTTNSSDLATQNLSRVAAPPPNSDRFCKSDVGLMVELKRWVAKDRAPHGQAVTETDLRRDYLRASGNGRLIPVCCDGPGRTIRLSCPKGESRFGRGKEHELKCRSEPNGSRRAKKRNLHRPVTQHPKCGKLCASAQTDCAPAEGSPKCNPAVPILPATDENTMIVRSSRKPAGSQHFKVSQPLGALGGAGST